MKSVCVCVGGGGGKVKLGRCVTGRSDSIIMESRVY